ncbi:MAG: amino acid ABC transporter permease [Clostridia bacterium]|nr:amino acid ABC transporter permease [Clostridia bacterium]
MDFSKQWSIFVKTFVTNEGYRDVLLGLKNTAYIAIFGFLIGVVIGTVIAIVKVSGKQNKVAKVFSKIGDIYVGFFRGTPIIVQLLLIYYVFFPLIGVKSDKLVVAIITFGLNSSAYVSEIMRSGIQSVDVGQLEAGRSLGMSYPATMIRIVIPQALKNSLPSLGNELIALVKDTSVAGFIAVFDLTQAFKLIGSSSYAYVIPYIVLALFYLVIVLMLTLIIKLIERRLRKSERH